MALSLYQLHAELAQSIRDAAQGERIVAEQEQRLERRAMAALIVFSIIASGIAAVSIAFWIGIDLDRGT